MVSVAVTLVDGREFCRAEVRSKVRRTGSVVAIGAYVCVPESRSSGAIRSEGAAAETRTGGSSISCSGSQRRESVTWDGAIRGYQHCALRDGNELADVAKRVDKHDHPHYFRQPQADASL